MADECTLFFFEREKKVEASNGFCCDCGTAEPQWASVSHGIYLSIEASGAHRSLGVKVSYVQSTRMDSWKPIHLRMMELGGNSKFTGFLQEHGIPDELPIRQKYNTRAAEWYRANLRALALGTDPPLPLSPRTGHLPSADAAASSPEQLILDQVFAKAPNRDDMTSGGVPVQDCRVSRRASSVGFALIPRPLPSCTAESRLKKRARPESGEEADGCTGASATMSALPKLLGRCSSLAAAHGVTHDDSAGSVWRFWTSKGERTAERLQTMSTGKMQGLGPTDCGPCSSCTTVAEAVCLPVVMDGAATAAVAA